MTIGECVPRPPFAGWVGSAAFCPGLVGAPVVWVIEDLGGFSYGGGLNTHWGV